MRILSRVSAGKVINNYATTPVTTGAWVQITASVPSSCSAVGIFDSSGRILKLSTGAPGFEDANELPFYIPPGGLDGTISIEMAKGKPLSAKAIDANATIGYMLLNFFG